MMCVVHSNDIEGKSTDEVHDEEGLQIVSGDGLDVTTQKDTHLYAEEG